MDNKEYSHFLNRKRIVLEESGITVPRESLNANLFEFQRDIVAWALRKGRAAIFCDCGMGKTKKTRTCLLCYRQIGRRRDYLKQLNKKILLTRFGC